MDSQKSPTQDTADLLRNANFTYTQHTPSPDNPVTASDFLLGAYDPAKLHPMAGLEDKLDYLLLDDDKTSDLPGSGTAIPSRGWSDDLCYGTGTMYLSGSSLHSRYPRLTSSQIPGAIMLLLFFFLFAICLVSHVPSPLNVSYCFPPSHVHLFSNRPRPWWCLGTARRLASSLGCVQFKIADQ